MPLILRTNKTEPLTHTELDGNLSHLDQRITALTNAEANKIITWTEIQSKPILFDGDYNSLSNLPSLFNGDYNSLTNTPVTFDGNYQSLTNKPGIPSNLADLANVQNTAPGIDQVLTWNGSSWSPQDKFSADYNDLTNKPVVPTLLSDLGNVSPTAPAPDEVLKWDGSQWAPGSDVGNIPTYAEVTDKNTANGPSKIAIGTIAGSTNQGNLAVAIGYEAGKTNQGANSIAIGVNAGETTQSTNATAVGISAGETTQGANATALGYYAGNANQGSEAVAIGDLAGSTNQGANATAVGNGAGEDTQGVSAVAVGDIAGALNQNTFAVAVGASAGMSSQGQAAVAIGKNSGETLQGSDTVAIGNSAGNTNQTAKAVAVGDWAGKTDQGASAVALGHLAGTTNQGQYATALGHYAGANDQSSNAIAVGYNAAYENQGSQAIAIGVSSANNQSANAIAIGSSAANNTQGEEAIAIGKQAGNGTQGTQAIAIGTDSGLTTQSDFAIAIGQEAGKTTQGTLALAVGNSAGVTLQGDGAVALGYTAGNANQGNLAIAIGNAAGTTTQGIKAIAIGEEAGNTNQGVTAIALGSDAGKTSQGNDGIAIGTSAALVTQGVNSVAIGRLAANNDQGANAVAIGDSAGKTTQGDYAIAIGNAAGETNQAANSIVINATSTAVENTTADSFVVKPIRNGNGTHQLEYNPTTGEITYDALGAGGYGDADVFTYLNVTFANDGDVLSWDTTAGDYAWVAQSSGGAGIALTDLSVTTASAGTAALTYNNTTGVFTYTPPDLSSFSTFDGDYNSLTNKPTIPTAYTDSDVDTHLNQSNPTSGYVLSWTGTDYDWVAQSGGGGATSINTAGNTGTGSVTFASETLTATGATGQIIVDAAGFSLSFSLDADLTGLTTINSHTIPGGTGTLALTSDIPTITGHSNLIAWDLSDTANSKVLDAGTVADSAWYYGDVVSDPANPATSVVLDIGAATPTFSGNVMGEVQGDVRTADGGTLVLDVDAGVGTAMYYGDVTGNVTGDVTGFVENEFDLTGSANPNYVFNADSKYFTSNTNNPTLYLKRGERYKFENIAASHPFRIQSVNSAAGTLYNDGVTNNAGTGTVTFIPPMDAPDELYYYCANHSSMNGVIKIVGEGSTASARTTGAATATALGDESAADITIPCAKTFTLLKIQTSHAAWVTLYIDTASRTNDAGRDINTDPEAGSGVLAEVITSDGSTINITPGTIGWNNDGTPAAQVYAKVVNKSGSQQDLTVTLHYVALEV